MRKHILAVCFIAIVAKGYLFSGQDTNTNFRLATWGISQEAVTKLEGKGPDRKEKNNVGLDILAFKGTAGGLDCYYAYFFAEDKLVEGRYAFVETHTNKNSYIDDFKSVKASLTEKYGKPTEDDTIWRNNLYKDDPSEWGMAVSVGHLIYQAKWTAIDTKIFLQLKGDNYKFTHVVQYTSTLPEHLDLVKKAEEKAKKNIW